MSNSEIEFKQIRNTITKGIVCTCLPIFILSKHEFFFENFPPFVPLLVFPATIILFLSGYIICWRGAYQYAKYKGYPGYLGIMVGITNIFGLSFLFLLRNKNCTSISYSQNDALENFSVSSIIIGYNAIPLLLYPLIIFILAYIKNIGIEETSNYLENEDFLQISYIPIYICIVWYFFRQIKKVKLDIRQIVGSLKNINLKLPIALFIAEYFFSWGVNDVTLYGLSFIVPSYVENQINQEHITTYFGLLAFAISAVIYAPIIEEIFFRGIILQKVAIARDVRAGILISAFVFAIVHFRYDIISLFTMGVVLAILYLKTKQLIIPIAFHFLHNVLATIWLFHHQFLSDYDHSVPIKIAEYQQDFIDHLGSRVLFIALSAPYLIYFIYKNFPRNYDIDKLPYFTNQKDYIN